MVALCSPPRFPGAGGAPRPHPLSRPQFQCEFPPGWCPNSRPGSLALEFLSAYDAKLNEMLRHTPSYKCKIIASCRYVFSVLYNKLVILYRGSPGGSAVKESACNAGDTGSIHHLEEGMATLSSVLALRIPWTEEAGGPQSMESERVRHDWSNVEYYT